jgi:hypothetical protein
MIRRPLYLLFTVMTATFPLRATGGLEVQTWRYDPQAHAVSVRLVNQSGKDITAFNLSVTEKFSDGTSQSSDQATDYLPLIASAELDQSGNIRQQHGNGTFPSGTSRDITLPEPKLVTNLSIIADLVVYSDRTVTVSNREAFDHLKQDRKGLLDAAQQANTALKNALNTATPAESASAELKRLAQVAEAQGHGIAAVTLRTFASQAKNSSGLRQLIKEVEARTSVYAANVDLREVSQ